MADLPAPPVATTSSTQGPAAPPSPTAHSFFHTTPTAEVSSLAILHLKRDSLIPVILSTSSDDGYAEGAVSNTRFGSFPHSTLIGVEWGSQVRASQVDTGTRGRPGKKLGGKRKSDELVDGEGEGAAVGSEESGREAKRVRMDGGAADEDSSEKAVSQTKKEKIKAAVEAKSGFVHLLQPTPEAWTASLDHRTQVVYTPDYSYILQRLRVKPGSRIIEAGAGSGSFTHAAARAVYSGPPFEGDGSQTDAARGTVFSFEYHEPRVQTLRKEIQAHGLEDTVILTHRDVCNDGFTLDSTTATSSPPSARANAIFLDLPAPWLALRHLTRDHPASPLDPDSAVHICTFSPCIEQVTATVSQMRKYGWTEIHMVEVANRRIDVRREHIGLRNEGLRGVNASAASVEESVGRLREVEIKLSNFHANKAGEEDGRSNGTNGKKVPTKFERLNQIKEEARNRKYYREGNLIHRTEPEVRTHTSYLVFAVLPRAWAEEDEKKAGELWPLGEAVKAPKRFD